MTLRYFISFPAEANVRPEAMRAFLEELKTAADDRALRDLAVSHGATIVDMRRPDPVPALVRRARARAR